MEILCALTDWETNVNTSGRGKGTESTRRLAIGGDLWCWNICYESTVGAQQGQKFFQGFRFLIPAAIKNFDIDFEFVRDLVVEKLSESISITDEAKQSILDEDDPKKAGEKIDNAFEVNYNVHEGVRDRIFKGVKSESA